MRDRAMAVRCVKAALADLMASVKAAPRRSLSPDDAMDATLRRLEAGVRQSGAAVQRARITPAQDAARTARFRAGRPLATPQTAVARAQQARDYRERMIVRKEIDPDDLVGQGAQPPRFIDPREGSTWRVPATLMRSDDMPDWWVEQRRAINNPQRLRAPWDLGPYGDGRGATVKTALWGILGSVKQSPQTPAQIQANLRQILAGSPGYVSSPPSNVARQTGRSLPRQLAGTGIETNPPNLQVNVGMQAPTALNWARYENRQQLRGMLGRAPTPEERRAGMQVRRQLARDAGQPFVAINPDNTPPWYATSGNLFGPPDYGKTPKVKLQYPETMTNPQAHYTFTDWLDEAAYNLGRPLTRREQEWSLQQLRSDYLADDGQHPIHPNANIRNPHAMEASDYFWRGQYDDPALAQLNIDPRLPERYNRTLPPNQRMSQDQMDRIRRDYYTQNPNLVPQPAQPGYEAWHRQNLRGR